MQNLEPIPIPMDLGGDSTELNVLNSSLDLETFATSFTGQGLFNRLLFVAKHAPPLSSEALRMAHGLVLKTCNTGGYCALIQLWQKIAADRPTEEQAPALDTEWVESANKAKALRLERLDSELKHFKSNSLKESIRKTFQEFGDYHLQCGDLADALKCYSRMRDYCGSTPTVVAMSLNIVHVNLHQQNWTNALSYISKAFSAMSSSTSSANDQNSASLAGYKTNLTCASGVAALSLGNYREAAGAFLEANLDDLSFSEVLSPNNVAVYGGLCALATYNRSRLQLGVLSSSSFKLFLELEPQVRDVLVKFHQSKYSSCLKTLEGMRDNLLLDMYLSRHVDTLYSMIRKKALVQYFSPYQCVSLHKMAEAFNTTTDLVEDEVATLLLDGQIVGKIDSQEKILFATSVDQRVSTFSQAVDLGDEHARSTHALVLHCALVKHKVNVTSSQRQDGADSSEPAIGLRRRALG